MKCPRCGRVTWRCADIVVEGVTATYWDCDFCGHIWVPKP